MERLRLRFAGLTAILLFVACGGGGGGGGGGSGGPGFLLGVALSPRGHTSSSTTQDWIDFYSGHAAYGRVIAFHGMWRDHPTGDGEIPALATAAMDAAAHFGFTPVVGLGWSDGAGAPNLTSESEPGNNSWTNAETRSEFLSMVTAFASTRHPPFLFLGNETNSYAVTHSVAEWAAWMSELFACYDAIKAASPSTFVFTTFQLEKMKGLGAATSGWTFAPQWGLLSELSASGKIDGVGFTTYPYFEYADPAAIPNDYYDEIAQHWTGPVLFTEVGWPAVASPPFPGGVAAQADFVPRFFALTERLDRRYAAWLFLHDWDGEATTPPFRGIGLRSNDGSVVRPSDSAWRASVVTLER
jgi:hypothetical protein